MTDLDELEFDYSSVGIDSNRAAAGRRRFAKVIGAMRENSAKEVSRRSFYATGNKPSLPRLKCLEKDQ